MKKLALLLTVLISLTACSEKESNLTVSGQVKGLKKGTLYLQKVEDTLLVNVDSVIVDGDPNFILKANIDSPQMMYLFLEKVDNNKFDDRIDFFADKGKVEIQTNLEKFETGAKITGATNQEKLTEYRQMISRFNDQNLDLIKESFEAEKSEDEDKLMEVDKKYDRLLRRKYLFTVNFAINNKDLEIAPYLALSEVFDANIKFLDTIYSSLTPKVKKSKYGKELKNYLKERREDEKPNSPNQSDSSQEENV
ncbi:DUF4369 domain-containing protein [Christiangramia salexigens]|uniref:DUF4369 domain-containing protein n=1 Tax=Christiangramia salexigens TaxID=1913577 RepID=A0A1L3J4I8_9FLAO|nr:DUF4369 domain-containing protein [Christiangramia salexigens]APG60048.1 hypothetical protein LPB144_06275 [Christiangramia salexigens]